MQRLQTVILEHTTLDGRHFDWLFEHPSDPLGALWAARVAWPSELWVPGTRWLLTALPGHRRRYLSYQGPLAGGRGQVRRIDSGYVLPIIWRSTRRVVDLQTRRCGARVELRQLAGERWQASFIAPTGSAQISGHTLVTS